MNPTFCLFFGLTILALIAFAGVVGCVRAAGGETEGGAPPLPSPPLHFVEGRELTNPGIVKLW